MAEMVSLGYISRASGLKGCVVAKLFNTQSQTLSPGKAVLLRQKNTQRPAIIDSIMDGGRLFFKDISNRNDAMALVGAEIVVDRAALPEVPADEFYLFSLEGARVVDQQGTPVGVVTGFSSNNAQDLFLVETTIGNLVLIPCVKSIVTKIDYEQKLLVIDPPHGLLDLAE